MEEDDATVALLGADPERLASIIDLRPELERTLPFGYAITLGQSSSGRIAGETIWCTVPGESSRERAIQVIERVLDEEGLGGTVTFAATWT